MKAISIYDVLRTIIREKEWYWVYLNGNDYGEDIITFNDFSTIMVLNEVSTYDRKIKELYETLISAKIAKKTNKSSIIVDFNQLHNILSKYGKITPEDIRWATGVAVNVGVTSGKVKGGNEA